MILYKDKECTTAAYCPFKALWKCETNCALCNKNGYHPNGTIYYCSLGEDAPLLYAKEKE